MLMDSLESPYLKVEHINKGGKSYSQSYNDVIYLAAEANEEGMPTLLMPVSVEMKTFLPKLGLCR